MAQADAGIPMIMLMWPPLVLLLAPIIAIETRILHRGGIVILPAFKATTVANLLSTVVGVPLTWLAYAIVEIGFALVFNAPGLAIEHWGEKADAFFKAHPAFAHVVFLLFGAPILGPTQSPDASILFEAGLVLLVPFFFASYWIERSILRNMLRDHDRSLLDRLCWQGNAMTYGLLAAILFGFLLWHYAHPGQPLP